MAYGSAFTNTPVTYLQWAKRQDPDGSPAAIAELLSKFTPLVNDALVMPSNMERSHRLTRRIARSADATWRGFNEGVLAGSSQVGQYDEGIGNLEDYSIIDKDLADLNGNSAQFLVGESSEKLSGMAEQMENQFWYGDGTNPNGFLGFTPRFDTLTGGNSAQVINGAAIKYGGASSASNQNHSIWMITWDPMTAFMLFPRGHSSGGLQMTDHGEVTTSVPVNASGTLYQRVGQFQAYQLHYKWMTGLAVKDPRYIVRCANIDNTDLLADSLNLTQILIEMQHKLYRQGFGKTIIYTTRAVATALDVHASEKTNVQLTHREYAGEYVLHFRNMPIRECDKLNSGGEADAA